MKKCKCCGKDMPIKFGGRWVFCSEECFNKFYGVKNTKLEGCAICGKPLTGKRRTYCSDECFNQSKKQERYEGYKRPQATTYPVVVVKKRGRPKKKMTLAEVNELAREENLTYGQYCAKHGLY